MLQTKILRESGRVRVGVRVRYGVGALDREDAVENISAGGLYIRTNDVVPVGSRIQLALELNGRLFHHSAEVTWAIRVPEHLRDSLIHGMGVQFVAPEPDWPQAFRKWRDSQER